MPRTTRVRYRKWLANLALLAGTLLLTVIALELLLRQWPEVLGYQFATRVLTKYSTAPNGIFYYDPSLKMQFMKPNFSTEQYWNGYRWHHETDDSGFRNPHVRTRADILLLGDSLIYGHGVNIEDTVGVLLERRTSYSVVSLGMMGNCAFQEAYLTAEYVPKFRPRYVFYFFFDNDIDDLYRHLNDQEMKEFIQRDLADITYKERTDPRKVIRSTSWPEYFRPRLYLSRAYDQLLLALKLKKPTTPIKLP